MKRTVGLICLLLSGLCGEAAVVFVGNDLVTDAAWRTPDVVKTNDLDGDNIYGTAGYLLPSGLRAGFKDPFLSDTFISGLANTDQINTLPSYIKGLYFTDPAQRGRSWGGDAGNFGTLDKVSDAHTGFTGAPILNEIADSQPLLLTLKRTNSPAFRMTFILGNNPNEEPFSDPNGQNISVDDGSGPVTQISGSPDLISQTTYQSWDIPAGNSDISISLKSEPADIGIARLSGIAIDSLTIAAPAITQQPLGGTFIGGIRYELAVGASAPELTYQWFKDTQLIPGATNSTLVLTNLSNADAGSYYVEVKNSSGTARSDTAAISLGTLPGKMQRYQTAILAEPSLLSYYTFDAADGTDLKNAHPGTLAGAATFSTGVGGEAAKALIAGTGHINLGFVEDFLFLDTTGTAEAWVRADWQTSPGYNPAIFTARQSGPTAWSIHMIASKTQIAFWNGSAAPVLEIPFAGTNWHHIAVVFDNAQWTLYWDGVSIGTSDNSIGTATDVPTEIGSASEVGQERWVGALDEVAFYSDALPPEAILAHYTAFTADDPPAITTQPKGGSFVSGVNYGLFVNASGPNLTYQWFRDDQAISWATNSTLIVTNLSTANAGAYYVEVKNSSGTVRSDTATLSFATLPPKLAKYQAAVLAESSLLSYYTFDAADGSDLKNAHPGTPAGAVTFETGIGGDPAKALVAGAGHVNLGFVEDFLFLDTTGSAEAWVRADWQASPGYNPAIFTARDGTPTAWSIHMTAAKNEIDFWNGSSSAALSIPPAGTNWHHIAVVFDNGQWTLYWDGLSVGTQAIFIGFATDVPTEIGSSSEAGGERWVGALDEVAFYSDALTADAVLSHYNAFAAGDPPVITTQPKGGILFAGVPFELSVGATGPNLTYAWSKNDQPIAGATSATLDFANLSDLDQGTYKVTVSNETGSQISEPVEIKIVIPNLADFKKAVLAETSLISFYPFDDGTPTDTKGPNEGTLGGNATFTQGVGDGADQALFSSADSYVSLGSVNDFTFQSGVGTVEAWIRADWQESPGYNPTIFAARDSNPTRWSIHMIANKNQLAHWNGAAVALVNIPNAGLSWHHLVSVFDNGVWRVYWDGSLVGSPAQQFGSGTDLPTQIGSSSSVGQELWSGAIDEVAFYSSALSAAAVQAHFDALFGIIAQPTLKTSRNGNQITLSWDTANFILQENSDLKNPNGWTASVNGSTSPVTITIGTETKFYRLKK